MIFESSTSSNSTVSKPSNVSVNNKTTTSNKTISKPLPFPQPQPQPPSRPPSTINTNNKIQQINSNINNNQQNKRIFQFNKSINNSQMNKEIVTRVEPNKSNFTQNSLSDGKFPVTFFKLLIVYYFV